MQIETERLTIRPWQPTQDARDAMDIYSDLQVVKWLDGEPQASSIRHVQGRLQRYVNQAKRYSMSSEADNRQHGWAVSWAVEQKDIGRVIGQVALMPWPDIRVNKVSPRPPTVTSTPSVGLNAVELASTGSASEGLSTDYIEMNWHFRPASWGYGYATEAAFGLAKYAFEVLRSPLLIAICEPQNKRAIALMNRLKMTDDGFTTRYFGGKALRLYRLDAINQWSTGHRLRGEGLNQSSALIDDSGASIDVELGKNAPQVS